MLQTVISRQAGNSFLIKGWSVGLVSVLCAFAAKDINVRFAILALLPALSFWGLDAYYLRQERLFRALYDCVAAQVRRPETNPQVPLFCMNTKCVADNVDNWWGVLFSRTMFALYGPILAAVIAVILYASISQR